MTKLSNLLANDSQDEFLGVSGFSTSNLWHMKGFCEAHTDSSKLAPLVREIGSHNIVITALPCASGGRAGIYQRGGNAGDGHQEKLRGGAGMSKLSKRLPDDNEKLQLLVGEISWSKNLILMAGGKDNLKREFYHAYRDLPKVQPPVAQIGWSHNLIIFQCCKGHLERKLEFLNAEAVRLATTIKKNFEKVGV